MRIKTAFICLSLALSAFFSSAVFAYDTVSFLSEARQKYERYRDKVQDLTLTQQMTLSSPEGQMVQQAVTRRKRDKFRTEMKMSLPDPEAAAFSMQMTVVSNGRETWMSSPYMGKRPLSAAEGRSYRTGDAFWGLFWNNAEVLKEEMLGNYDCVVVRVEDDGKPCDLWIEKGSFNLIQVVSETPEGQWTLWSSDFRKVLGDWEIPFKSEAFMNGQLVTSVIVQDVQVNQGLPDAMFEPDSLS